MTRRGLFGTIAALIAARKGLKASGWRPVSTIAKVNLPAKPPTHDVTQLLQQITLLGVDSIVLRREAIDVTVHDPTPGWRRYIPGDTCWDIRFQSFAGSVFYQQFLTEFTLITAEKVYTVKGVMSDLRYDAPTARYNATIVVTPDSVQFNPSVQRYERV